MKTKSLLITLFITLFYACEISNISDIEINSLDLVGTWSLTNFTIDNAVLNVTNPVITTLTADGLGKNYNATLTFTESPNNATINGDFTLELTYTQAGTIYNEDVFLDSLLFNDNFGFLSSSWQLNSNVLTLNEGGEQLDINVISYINNVLTIEMDVNKTITIDDVTATVRGKAILTLEK